MRRKLNITIPRTAIAGALAAAALASCASVNGFQAHANRHKPVAIASESWRLAQAAITDGRTADAEQHLRDAVDADPEFVRAWRRLQDLQILTFRRDDAIREAEAEITKNPSSPRGYYLSARLREGAARRRLLEKALEIDPWYGWAHQGLAACAEDEDGPGAGLIHASRATELLPDEPDPWLSLIHSLRAGNDQNRIVNIVSFCVKNFSKSDPRFLELMIRLLGSRASRPALTVFNSFEVMRELSVILQNAGTTRALVAAVRAGGPREAQDEMEIALAAARAAPAVPPELEIAHCLLAAELAQQSGRVTEHRRELERVWTLGERTPAVARQLRLARIVAKDYRNAWALEEDFILQFGVAVTGASSLDRDLLAAAAFAAASMPGDPAVLLSFARTAARYGWIDEAVELAEQSLQIGESIQSPAPGAAEFQQEVRAFRRFLTKMRGELERESRANLGLTGALDPFRELSRKLLGRDCVEGTKIEDHFPLGSLIITKPGSPGLPALFEQNGLELRMGKRFFGPVEAAAIRRAAAREIEGNVLGRPYRGREVIGEGASLFTQIEANAGPFAGATLPGSVWIVLDVVADAARSLEREREAMARDARDGRADRWRQQELPIINNRAERLAADETFDLGRRLVRCALARDPSPLTPRALEIVRLHEYGHLADAEQFLPFLSQLPRALWWLLDGGFSIQNIEGRLEKRAELVALCLTKDPELSLANIVQHAGSPWDSPPHSVGFADIAREFAQETDRMAVRGALPAIDRTRPVLPQVWKLTAEEIRSVALALARREGLVGDLVGGAESGK